MAGCCPEIVRGSSGQVCKLSDGHTGPHASVGYICEGCGKRRRGHPHATVTAPDDVMSFCFLCVRGLS